MLRSGIAVSFLALGLMVLPLRAAEPECRVRVVNHYPGFLNGIAVDLDAGVVYGKLQMSGKGPLSARVGESLIVPVELRNDRIRILLSLRPHEELELILTPSEKWETEWYSSESDKDGRLRKFSNGLLTIGIDDSYQVTLAPGGAKSRAMLEGDASVMLSNFTFEVSLNAYGGEVCAIKSAVKSITGASLLRDDNRIGLRVERQFNVADSAVKAVENFLLPAGLPVLEYTLRVENAGEDDLYISKEALFSGECAASFGAMAFSGRPFGRDGNVLNASNEENAGAVNVLQSYSGKSLVFLNSGMEGCLSLGGLDAGRDRFAFRRIGSAGGGQFIKLPARRALAAGYRICNVHPDQSVSGTGEPGMPPVAVYLDDQIYYVPRVSVYSRGGFRVDDSSRSWIMGMDFDSRKILQIDVSAIAGSRAAVYMRQLPDGERMEICSFNEPGSYTADLGDKLSWSGVKDFELTVSCGTNDSSYVDVNSLSVAEPLPVPPEIISPGNSMRLTDIASQFSWRKVPGVLYHDVQVARDAGFSRDVLQKRVASWDDKTHCLLKDLRGIGRHYWRIRSVNGRGGAGLWSDVHKVVLDDDYGTKPVSCKISALEPMFIFDATSLTMSPAELIEEIPVELRSSFVLNVGGKDSVLADELLAVKKYNMPVFISGCHSLSEIEMAFQDFPDLAGITYHGQSGYYLDGDVSALQEEGLEQLKRLVLLCAKYGKYFILLEGNRGSLHWQRLCRDRDLTGLFRKYSNCVVVGHSFALSDSSFSSLDQTMGMMLDGMVSHLAVGGSAEFWRSAGYGSINQNPAPGKGDPSRMPPIVYCQQFIQGISRGADILFMTGCGELIKNRDDLRKVMAGCILPFWRGVVENGMVPSDGEVLGSAKAVIIPDGKEPADKPWGMYGDLYSVAYGVSGEESVLREYIPNISRYYFLPILPYDTGGLSLEDQERKTEISYIPLSRMQDSNVVSRVLDKIYPRVNISKAWVGLVGNKFYVMNTYENKSVSESFSIDFKEGFVKRIHGRVIPHMYVMGKVEVTGFVQRQKLVAQGGAVWIQCDAHDPGHNMEIVFDCSGAPTVEVTPRVAHLHKLWRMAEQQLVLVLSSRAGPVQVKIAPRSD